MTFRLEDFKGDNVVCGSLEKNILKSLDDASVACSIRFPIRYDYENDLFNYYVLYKHDEIFSDFRVRNEALKSNAIFINVENFAKNLLVYVPYVKLLFLPSVDFFASDEFIKKIAEIRKMILSKKIAADVYNDAVITYGMLNFDPLTISDTKSAYQLACEAYCSFEFALSLITADNPEFMPVENRIHYQNIANVFYELILIKEQIDIFRKKFKENFDASKIKNDCQYDFSFILKKLKND